MDEDTDDVRRQFAVPDSRAELLLQDVAFGMGELVTRAERGEIDCFVVMMALLWTLGDLSEVARRQQGDRFEGLIENPDTRLYDADPVSPTRH